MVRWVKSDRRNPLTVRGFNFIHNEISLQIVRQTPLEASMPTKSPQSLVFSPGAILIDRCSVTPLSHSLHPRSASFRLPSILAASRFDESKDDDSGLQVQAKGLGGLRGGLMKRSWPIYIAQMAGRSYELTLGRDSSERDLGLGLGESWLGTSSVRDGDVFCCLDAVSSVTGELLWSRCIDQSQSCRTGQAREAVEGVVMVFLGMQLLAVITGLGYLLTYCF